MILTKKGEKKMKKSLHKMCVNRFENIQKNY